jgi:gliding motility-associated-like protein
MSIFKNKGLAATIINELRIAIFCLILLLLLPTLLFAQLKPIPDVIINPGVPVTLTARYGLIAEPVTSSQPGDDWVEGPNPIGFDFIFFGELYKEFYAGANGFISFSPLDVTANYRDAFRIPCASDCDRKPKICILGAFCDLNPTGSGSPYIYYKTIGTKPNRKLAVIWCQSPMNSCPQEAVTFQIVLYEGSNTIEDHILQKPECIQLNGNKVTVGLHFYSTTRALGVPAINAQPLTVVSSLPKAWRFVTNSKDDYIVSQIPFSLVPITPGDKIEFHWYEGSGTEPFSSDSTVVVTPNATTTYRVTATLCGGATFETMTTVNVVPYIPNAFMPDGDVDDNRYFRILGLPKDNITDFNIQIFDRWGQVVYSSNDIYGRWDGTMMGTGDPCPESVYAWVIYWEDNKKTRTTNKGTITLIR